MYNGDPETVPVYTRTGGSLARMSRSTLHPDILHISFSIKTRDHKHEAKVIFYGIVCSDNIVVMPFTCCALTSKATPRR